MSGSKSQRSSDILLFALSLSFHSGPESRKLLGWEQESEVKFELAREKLKLAASAHFRTFALSLPLQFHLRASFPSPPSSTPQYRFSFSPAHNLCAPTFGRLSRIACYACRRYRFSLFFLSRRPLEVKTLVDGTSNRTLLYCRSFQVCFVQQPPVARLVFFGSLSFLTLHDTSSSFQSLSSSNMDVNSLFYFTAEVMNHRLLGRFFFRQLLYGEH